MTSISQNKEELLHSISSCFEKLRADYSDIPENLTRVNALDGNVKGTKISICDTLAYLIGWAALVLKWHHEKSLGQTVSLPEEGFNWNQLGQLAQKFHSDYKEWSYPALLEEFESTTNKILSLVNSLPNDDLYGDYWYKTYTFGRMIQFNTSSPMKNIRIKVRKFKGTNGLF